MAGAAVSLLPVDAHPALLLRPDDGLVWRPRIQSFDSTFGLEPTDPITLHSNGVAQSLPSLPANPLFDDSKSYWFGPNPAIGNLGWSSVPVPNTGTDHPRRQPVGSRRVHAGAGQQEVAANRYEHAVNGRGKPRPFT